MKEFHFLGYTEGNAIVSAALAKAAKLGIKIAVTVLDGRGVLIAAGASDGIRHAAPEMAHSKAWTALAFQKDTSEEEKSAAKRPGVEKIDDYLPIPGGLCLRYNADSLVGTVGVSGGSAEQDVECAEAGRAAFAEAAAS